MKQIENKFQSWIESLHEGVCMVDPYENIIYANPAFSNIIGYSREEMLGRNLSEFVPEEEFKKIMQETGKRKRQCV